MAHINIIKSRFSFIHSCIHSAVCLTTGPKPLPRRVLHTLRSSVSSFNFQYPIFSLRSSSSCLRLRSHLPVTSILPSIFPPITCFRRQLVCKMWPIKLPLLVVIVCTIFLSSWLFVTLLHFSHDWSNRSYPSFSSTTFQTFQVLLIYFPNCPRFIAIHSYAPNLTLY